MLAERVRLAHRRGLRRARVRVRDIARRSDRSHPASCVVTPGIRLPGDADPRPGPAGHAARGLDAGADMLVVGRTVTEADDPVAAAAAVESITPDGAARERAITAGVNRDATFRTSVRARVGRMPQPPTLTPEQRQAALVKAAEARRARAELKERLKMGSVSLAELLEQAEHDEVVGKTKVLAVLESLPGVGKVKARRTMEEIGIADTRRVRGLGRSAARTLLGRLLRLTRPAVLVTVSGLPGSGTSTVARAGRRRSSASSTSTAARCSARSPLSERLDAAPSFARLAEADDRDRPSSTTGSPSGPPRATSCSSPGWPAGSPTTRAWTAHRGLAGLRRGERAAASAGAMAHRPTRRSRSTAPARRPSAPRYRRTTASTSPISRSTTWWSTPPTAAVEEVVDRRRRGRPVRTRPAPPISCRAAPDRLRIAWPSRLMKEEAPPWPGSTTR